MYLGNANDNLVPPIYPNLFTTQQVSQNPLDYVSPQSAIAAGLPAGPVSTTWVNALAKFPTQNDALAAGVPPTVVTALWARSRAAMKPPRPNPSWLYILGGVGLLIALSRKKTPVPAEA